MKLSSVALLGSVSSTAALPTLGLLSGSGGSAGAGAQISANINIPSPGSILSGLGQGVSGLGKGISNILGNFGLGIGIGGKGQGYNNVAVAQPSVAVSVAAVVPAQVATTSCTTSALAVVNSVIPQVIPATSVAIAVAAPEVAPAPYAAPPAAVSTEAIAVVNTDPIPVVPVVETSNLVLAASTDIAASTTTADAIVAAITPDVAITIEVSTSVDNGGAIAVATPSPETLPPAVTTDAAVLLTDSSVATSTDVALLPVDSSVASIAAVDVPADIQTVTLAPEVTASAEILDFTPILNSSALALYSTLQAAPSGANFALNSTTTTTGGPVQFTGDASSLKALPVSAALCIITMVGLLLA